MNTRKSMETDVLVIGGGGAGLRAAYEAAKSGLRVTLATKGKPGKSGCTNLAGSEYMAYGAALGIADSRDTPRIHEADTLRAAMGMADEPLVRILTEESIDRFQELIELGGRFDRTPEGTLAQRVSDAATYPRVLGKQDTTGREIMRVLWEGLDGRIQVLEGASACDLLLAEGAVRGAVLLDRAAQTFFEVHAGATVLCTGGPGGLYSFDTFPPDVTGDGYAMAYRAGAKLVNTEFLQIGLVLARPRLPRIISATTWRLEPEIYNEDGEDLLEKYLPAGKDRREIFRIKATSFPYSWRTDSCYIDLSIFREVMRGKRVFVDVSRHSEEHLRTVCPNNYRFLLAAGVDIAKQPIEVSCGVQHMNGGILINERCETSLPGLFAAGECAGAQHGADRPGGNALADTQVYGRRAGLYAARYAAEHPERRVGVSPHAAALSVTGGSEAQVDALTEKLRRQMWEQVLNVRTEEGLAQTLAIIDQIEAELPGLCTEALEKSLRLHHLLDTGRIIAFAALQRRESRGTHYRADYPYMDDEGWRKQIVTQIGADGKITSTLRLPRKNLQKEEAVSE